ncbi:MAG: DUF2111 domain-containing protein [Candidatus Methanomethylophilaceae archaeon]|nr:DUF2111 domain-containing protein [Candidatus Methanomethylophilaceae archaeon]
MKGNPGNLPSSSAKFTNYHVWKALMCIEESIPIGRKKLSTILGIGEGSTRTLLTLLDRHGCTYTNKTGIYLSEEGAKIKNKIMMDVAHLNMPGLTISDYDCAVRIPFASRKIKYGIEESDEAIKNGALGATTLVFIDGHLYFPSLGGKDDRVDPRVEETFMKMFRLRNDDVLIIGTARTPEDAEKGAVSVALSLLGGLKFKQELKDLILSPSNTNDLIALAFAIHELVGGLPVCAKHRNNLGIRIEDGMVIDNAYTGDVLEECIQTGKTFRTIAESGPYKGIRVIVTPIDYDGTAIAAIGVVDVKELFHNYLTPENP